VPLCENFLGVLGVLGGRILAALVVGPHVTSHADWPSVCAAGLVHGAHRERGGLTECAEAVHG
jgi:hypothetical protein